MWLPYPKYMSQLLSQMTDFQVIAQFLGIIIKDGDRVKYLKVAISSQEYWVKLPKKLSQRFDLNLTDGSWLEIEGTQTLDRQKVILKLKASSLRAANCPNSELNHKLKPKLKSTLTSSSGVHNVVEKKKNKASCILICQKSDCWLQGGKEIYQSLEQELRDRGWSDRIQIQKTGCQKQCKQAPNLVVMPNKDRHSRVKASQVKNLLNRCFG